MTKLRQWVLWKLSANDNKKIPCQTNGRYASINKPKTWCSFSEALNSNKTDKYSGLGFVFCKSDPYAGIDFDKVINPKTGEIEHSVLRNIKILDSYTEYSQSETGIHVIVKGKIPHARKTDKIEIYDSFRFFVMTGNHLDDTPYSIENRQKELNELLKTSRPNKQIISKTKTRDDFRMGEEMVLRRARSAKNSFKFDKLWQGDWTGYPSQSEADLALCRFLAFHSDNNTEIVDSLFRYSGLFRTKWDEPRGDSTYGRQTIKKSIGGR